MRPIRWKSRYLTGIPERDRRNGALVDMLNAMAGEASRVEHCQDLNDFFSRITSVTEDMLKTTGGSPGEVINAVATYETELNGMLETGLPLAARDAPACTDCCMCSLLEKGTKAWLGKAFRNRAQCDAVPV